MAMEASQAQPSVQQNACKDVKTDSEVSSDELEEEVVEEKKHTEVIEEKKPGPKAEQKPVTKSRPVASTPITDTVWCVVRTNDRKHFFYNPTKRQSVWKIPEELKNRPDVDKLLLPKPEMKTEKKEEKDLQEEPPSKKIRLKKEGSNNEITQQTVLEKKTTNVVEVQIAKNMPVASLEDKKKKFKELLAENNVKTPSTWKKELHKVGFDERYTLLTAQERKQTFKEYVKDRTDVKPKKRSHVNKNSELYRIMQSLEECDLDVKLEVEMKEEKEKNNNEIAQQTLLEEKTTNTVEVQTTENMPVVSLEDRKKQFKELLAEKNVLTPSTWEKELHKVVFDKRYNLLTFQERKQTYKEYVKDRAEVNYTSYRQLLEESDLDIETSFKSFAVTHSDDKRFRNIINLKNRKYMFQFHITELAQQEKKMNRSILEKVRIDFMKMLGETPGIDQHTLWRHVRRKLYLDPRYKAAVISSRRQSWFKEYLKTENDVKEDFMKMLGEIPDIDSSTSWSDVKNKVSSDPPYKAVSETRQEEWFRIYLKTLKNVKSDFMKMLSEIPDINPSTSWGDVKSKVSSDPRYKAVSDTHQEEWFKTYLKTVKDVKGDFMKMLSEIPGINPSTSWADVKNKVGSDPRYKAVSDTHQEEWFKTYLKTVKDAASDDIKNKEEQDKSLHSSSLKEKDESGKSHGEVAIEDNKKLLAEKVKTDFIKMLSETPDIAHYSWWRDVRKKLCQDPRYKAVGLESRCSDWFYDYLRAENVVKGDFMKMLREIPDINPSTSWDDVKNKVSSDPRLKAVSDTRQQEWFKTYLKTVKDVKGDFMKMLREIPDINPSTSWDDVKNKVSSDPRLKAVSDTRQQEWFKTYLKTVKDVKGDFMKMLREIPDINPSTSWDDVKNKVSSDPRLKAVSDTRQQEWFKTYLKTVKDVKGDFMKILSEIPGINPSTSWADVKSKVASDPRYKAVSDTCQEELFKTYLETVKDATSDDIKTKEKKDKSLHSSSLKEKDESGKSHGEVAIEDFTQFPVEKVTSDDIRKKEVQEKQLVSSSLKRKNTTRQNHRETAVEDFKKFLFKKVKDTKMSFTTFKARFLINPRWIMELSEKEKKELYDSHINEMPKKNREILWSVLEEMNLPLEAEWSEVKKQVEADPRYVNYTDSEEQLADAQFMKEKIRKTKKEFQELLSEMELDTLQTKIMLQQKSITMSDILYIIRQDKRYTALDSLSEQREQMLLASINELNTNNQTPR